jgi:hypothetical protein
LERFLSNFAAAHTRIVERLRGKGPTAKGVASRPEHRRADHGTGRLFSEAGWEYKPQKPDGSLGSAVKAGYDVKANKKV